jgi:hypothetical protein
MNPCTMFTYYRNLDHAKEDCPQLITKWQKKRNQSVQMIEVEENEDRPRVVEVMCGGERIGTDAMDQGNLTNQWVSKEAEPPPKFDLQKERDTYKQARKELLEIEWGASTSQPVYGMPPLYDMPPSYDHSMTGRTVEKVCTMKIFLQSFLELMKNETALNALHGMIN